MGLSNELSCEAGVSPAASTPTGVFSQRFEALFPCAGALGFEVCLAAQLFLPVYLHVNVGLPSPPVATSPGLPAAALPRVLSAPLPVSAPPTGLGECFFFISLVVRLPYSSVFCQFWLFFVFKCVVVLLLVVQGGTQYVYLRLHLGRKSPQFSILTVDCLGYISALGFGKLYNLSVHQFSFW